MKSFTSDLPPARAYGHLADAHAKAGNVEAAREYAKQAATYAKVFIRGRQKYVANRDRKAAVAK